MGWNSFPSGVSVSCVFRAHNDETSIANTIFIATNSTDNQNVEFIAVDDRSTDGTWSELQRVEKELVSRGDSRFRAVRGHHKPGKVAWRGKNWALTQGAKEARGTHFLFVDSDVRLLPKSIEAFVSSLEMAEGVGWISFLPKTKFTSFAEYLFGCPGTCIAQGLIPAMTNSRRGLAYAFGQCNLFKRDTYELLGGHRQVGHEFAESQALAKEAKTKEVPFRCQLAFQQAELTRYSDFGEGWRGELKRYRNASNTNLDSLPTHLVHNHTDFVEACQNHSRL